MMLLSALVLGLLVPLVRLPVLSPLARKRGRSTGIFDVTLCTSDDHCVRPLYCCTGALFNYCCVNGRPSPSSAAENYTYPWPMPAPA